MTKKQVILDLMLTEVQHESQQKRVVVTAALHSSVNRGVEKNDRGNFDEVSVAIFGEAGSYSLKNHFLEILRYYAIPFTAHVSHLNKNRKRRS